MPDTCPPSLRRAVRQVAILICAEESAYRGEPCRDCMVHAPALIGKFLLALPQGESFTPASLLARMRRSGADA